MSLDPRPLERQRHNPSISFVQAKAIVMTAAVPGLDLLANLLRDHFRQHPGDDGDPYLPEIDRRLLSSLGPWLDRVNALLPADQRLRTAPRADGQIAAADPAALRAEARNLILGRDRKRSPALDIPGLPEDFDPDDYLDRHFDVDIAGIDAGYHYLTFGRFEGRRYTPRHAQG